MRKTLGAVSKNSWTLIGVFLLPIGALIAYSSTALDRNVVVGLYSGVLFLLLLNRILWTSPNWLPGMALIFLHTATFALVFLTVAGQLGRVPELLKDGLGGVFAVSVAIAIVIILGIGFLRIRRALKDFLDYKSGSPLHRIATTYKNAAEDYRRIARYRPRRTNLQRDSIAANKLLRGIAGGLFAPRRVSATLNRLQTAQDAIEKMADVNIVRSAFADILSRKSKADHLWIIVQSVIASVLGNVLFQLIRAFWDGYIQRNA